MTDQPEASAGMAPPTGPVAAVRHQMRSRRWAAVALLVFVVLFAALLGWQVPTSLARAVGVATEVTATVESVQLADDQPRKKRNGPVWSMGLRWTDAEAPGGFRTGISTLKSDDPPFTVGRTVSAFVIDGSDRASLGIDTDDATKAWLMVALIVVMISAAAGLWWSTRRWKRLLRVRLERDPARVRVIRVGRSKAGWGVDYRPITGVRLPNTLDVIKRGRLAPPEPDEELVVWSLGADGSGPLLVRQVDNDVWWAASGSLH
jgi:hypothetical protein